MDLHTITAPPQSYFVKEKLSAARIDQLVTALLQRVGYTSRCAGTGWVVLLPCSPQCSYSTQWERGCWWTGDVWGDRELHTRFARQGGGKAGMSLSTFVSRMCWALGNPGVLISNRWLSKCFLEKKYVALMTDLLTRKMSTGSLCLWWGM